MSVYQATILELATQELEQAERFNHDNHARAIRYRINTLLKTITDTPTEPRS